MKIERLFTTAVILSAFLSSDAIVAVNAWAETRDGAPDERPPVVEESKNQIVKLTDRGLSPEVVHMNHDEMILFFFNDSTDSLATLEIDYGERVMHCAGGNLRAGEDGIIRSVRPFGPRDFASVCFHDPGEYSLKVYGLKSNPKGIVTKVIVE